LFNQLANYNIKKIIITGHTDNQGNKDYNQLLSENRSNRVRQFFLDRGIDYSKIETSSFGLEKPVANNFSEESKLINRRVEIIVFYEDKIINIIPSTINPIKEIKETKAVNSSYNSLDELMIKLQKPPRCYTINNSRDTALVGNNGVVLYIKANSFDKNLKMVNVYLKEDVELVDMLLDGLTTQSGDRILESAGMIQTSAKDLNGNKIELENDKSIVVLMPSENPNPSMELFDGDSVNGKIDWKLSSQKIENTRDYDYPKKKLLNEAKSCSKGELKEFNKLMNSSDSTLNNLSTPKLKSNIGIWERLSSGERVFDCESLKKYFKKYKVSSTKELYMKIKKEQTLILFKQYGVNDKEQLYAKMKEAEEAYKLIMKRQETFNYIFEQKKLGWRNCDVFSEYKQRKIMLKTDIVYNQNEKITLVFTQKKSMIDASISNLKNYQFMQIPIKVEFTLFGIKLNNGKPMFGMKNIVSSTDVETLEFVESTEDEIKKALSKIK
jgi:hypothetical protein